MINFVATLEDNFNLAFQGQIIFCQQTHPQERIEQERTRKSEERKSRKKIQKKEPQLMMISKIIRMFVVL